MNRSFQLELVRLRRLPGHCEKHSGNRQVRVRGLKLEVQFILSRGLACRLESVRISKRNWPRFTNTGAGPLLVQLSFAFAREFAAACPFDACRVPLVSDSSSLKAGESTICQSPPVFHGPRALGSPRSPVPVESSKY